MIKKIASIFIIAAMLFSVTATVSAQRDEEPFWYEEPCSCGPVCEWVWISFYGSAGVWVPVCYTMCN